MDLLEYALGLIDSDFETVEGNSTVSYMSDSTGYYRDGVKILKHEYDRAKEREAAMMANEIENDLRSEPDGWD